MKRKTATSSCGFRAIKNHFHGSFQNHLCHLMKFHVVSFHGLRSLASPLLFPLFSLFPSLSFCSLLLTGCTLLLDSFDDWSLASSRDDPSWVARITGMLCHACLLKRVQAQGQELPGDFWNLTWIDPKHKETNNEGNSRAWRQGCLWSVQDALGLKDWLITVSVSEFPS